MIVDTSAVLAVLFGEPDAERYERAIAEASHCRMSVASFLEAAIVLERRSGAAVAHELGWQRDIKTLIRDTRGHRTSSLT